MAVQVVTLANAVVAVVPAAAAFFLAYGRYDGTFRDNVVFLYFIGGLILGGFLGFLSLFALATLAPLLAVLLLALVVPIGMVAGINRRKWQGERHAVFNGGAFGLGVSVMVALSFLYYRASTLSAQAPAALGLVRNETGALPPGSDALIAGYVREQTLAVAPLAQALLFAAALAGLCFALGLLAGNGVRRKRQFMVAFLGTAIVLAPLVFIEELFQSWRSHAGGEWLWIGLAAAYGLIAGVAAERKLLPEGVEEEARKQRRRLRRKTA